MAYSTSNPPMCLVSAMNASSNNIWLYKSTDAATAVDADGYITNGEALGMRVGDIVFVLDTDASPIALTVHVVSAINTDGSVDLADGVALGSTNSD